MEYRLNKYISSSGFCSRREADRLIEEGHVRIDGKRAAIGMRVLPGQKVTVRGELIKNDVEPIYIAFNKPVGVVSTTDPQEKDNIVEFISHEQRIFPIGRLDKDSQGLILLTNNGDIVNKILRVGNNHKKEYIVKVDRPITKDFLERMAQGVPILDRVTRRCELEEINPYTFRITLIQGLNRQIRRMCEYFGYNVLKLERIQVMNIKLGSLGQGNWRELTHVELEGLFDMLEASKDVAEKNFHSNKSMNRALQEYDIKTNYRKASSVAKLQAKKPSKKKYADKDLEFDEESQKTKVGKNTKATKAAKTTRSKSTFTEAMSDDKPKKARKPKQGTGMRIGKSKTSKVKAVAKKMSDAKKRKPKK